MSEISTIGVAGAGTMGTGIAIVASDPSSASSVLMRSCPHISQRTAPSRLPWLQEGHFIYMRPLNVTS